MLPLSPYLVESLYSPQHSGQKPARRQVCIWTCRTFPNYIESENSLHFISNRDSVPIRRVSCTVCRSPASSFNLFLVCVYLWWHRYFNIYILTKGELGCVLVSVILQKFVLLQINTQRSGARTLNSREQNPEEKKRSRRRKTCFRVKNRVLLSWIVLRHWTRVVALIFSGANWFIAVTKLSARDCGKDSRERITIYTHTVLNFDTRDKDPICKHHHVRRRSCPCSHHREWEAKKGNYRI